MAQRYYFKAITQAPGPPGWRGSHAVYAALVSDLVTGLALALWLWPQPSVAPPPSSQTDAGPHTNGNTDNGAYDEPDNVADDNAATNRPTEAEIQPLISPCVKNTFVLRKLTDEVHFPLLPAQSPASGPLPWLYTILAIVLSGLDAAGILALLGDARERKRTMAVVLAERDALARKDTSSGVVPYRIDLDEPTDTADIDDAAAIIGRIGIDSGGRDLNVPATIAAAVRRAGEPHAHFSPRQRMRTVLALVDMESGDHPCADDVAWLLARWRLLSVPVVRYDYEYRPHRLRPAGGGPAVDLNKLAQTYPGAVVVVLSALAHPKSRDGHAPWVEALHVGPTAAVVDLDPRPVDERPYDVAQVRAACAEADLGPFPMSGDGLVAAAYHLAGQPVTPPPWPELAPISDPVIADALRSWAVCVACVPRPSWRHLESLRRAGSLHSEIGQHLDSPAYVFRLIEWLETHPEVRTARMQTGIDMPRTLEIRLVSQQRDRDGGELERRTRKILVEQLERATIVSEYERLRRDFKRDGHLTLLGKTRVTKMIGQYRQRALAPELSQFLQRELDTQGQTTTPIPWDDDRALALALVEEPHQAQVAGLQRGMAFGTVGWLLAAVCTMIPLLGSPMMTSGGTGETADYLQPVWQVVADVALPPETAIAIDENGCRPDLVEIPAGTFTRCSSDSTPPPPRGQLHNIYLAGHLRNVPDSPAQSTGSYTPPNRTN